MLNIHDFLITGPNDDGQFLIKWNGRNIHLYPSQFKNKTTQEAISILDQIITDIEVSERRLTISKLICEKMSSLIQERGDYPDPVC